MKHQLHVDRDQTISNQDTGTGTATGSSYDLQRYEAASLVFSTDAPSAGADVRFTIEESDDDSNWSEVDSADLEGTVPNYTDSDSARTDSVDYFGTSRYLRVNYDASNGSAGATVSVLVERGQEEERGADVTA